MEQSHAAKGAVSNSVYTNLQYKSGAHDTEPQSQSEAAAGPGDPRPQATPGEGPLSGTQPASQTVAKVLGQAGDTIRKGLGLDRHEPPAY